MRPLSDTLKAAVVAAIAGCWIACLPAARSASAPESDTPLANPAPAQPSPYKNGRYMATGRYGTQNSSITVTVTLAQGIITSTEVTPHATVPRSLELQQRFAAAVPAVVVGKPIDEVNVGRLAGSSGTPRGFNDAIQQIRKQAAAGN
ncbi:hypothetical protein D9M68_106940 [compost metagenome]